MSADRLSPATLAELVALPPQVRTPPPRPAQVGIVHLGVGAFHRAHQAVFTEDAAVAAGEDRWGILGVTGRSAGVAEQLVPQDGLYGVLTAGRTESSLRIVGTLLDVAHPGGRTRDVLQAIATPATHVVSLTITEKGYRRAAGEGPDLTDSAVLADLAALAAELVAPSFEPVPAATPVGLLVRGLALRQLRSGAPLTVVCCDNMVDNGRVLATLVRGLVEAVPAPAPRRRVQRLLDWLGSSVRFPGTMVDRIVPATTPEHRSLAESVLGLHDAALVVGEPFAQWVVEDDFAGPRPRWESAGAIMTGDVGPYERVKLRILNGTHSAVAYLGALRGHATIAEAIGDPAVRDLALRLIDQDVLPTLAAPAGLDLERYRDTVLERFANPNTGHTTIQVSADGSQKLPIRLFGTAADRLAAGAVPAAVAEAVAAWMLFVHRGRSVTGAELRLDDPLADRLRAAAAGSTTGLADRMLAVQDVVPDRIAADDGFRAEVRSAVARLDALLTGG